eukprot:TRINITY_DN37437_c0_g1_i1.p1 TRINITY_DN37437_c0_g1~~TRINITY_DN37437_c0_g1_i1.p1  ORF type:complete len:397 (+),score=89.44 TRINITY_DN37437_c0_g1_i1:93-1193(+)
MVFVERSGKPPAGSAAAAVRLRPTTPRSFDLAAAVSAMQKPQGKACSRPPNTARWPREPSAPRSRPRPPSAGRMTVKQAVAGAARANMMAEKPIPMPPARCPTRTPSPRGRMLLAQRGPAREPSAPAREPSAEVARAYSTRKQAVACAKAVVEEHNSGAGRPVATPQRCQQEDAIEACNLLNSNDVVDRAFEDAALNGYFEPDAFSECASGVEHEVQSPVPQSEPGGVSEDRSNRVAEAWLRLARIVLLEMVPRCPAQRLGSQHPRPKLKDILAEAEEAAEAQGGEAPPCHWQKDQVCLGDMMEQSVSWFEPEDDDDDCHSPKQSEQRPQQDEEEEEEEMHPAMKAVARQQKAPGIVPGLPKCLSF